MFRKPREPAPFFNMPGAPFNPATGQRAPLQQYPVKGTTLALFQVVGDDPDSAATEDTHDNYVVCRGYEADDDPYFRYLHDPHTAENTTPINVAKPYSIRGTFPYKQGQVIVAARIKGRLGYNPGKAVTVGQPADLNEEISLLKDDDGVAIAWMDLGSSQAVAEILATGTKASGFVTWSSPFNVGGLITVSTTKLIAAGVTAYYRVEWCAKIDSSFTTVTNVQTTCNWLLNGLPPPAHGTYATGQGINGLPSANYSQASTHSGFFYVLMAPGDYLQLNYAPNPATILATVHITPGWTQ